MEYVKSFRDLEVYKLSRQLSREIFELSKKFPKIANNLLERYFTVGKMLNSMMERDKNFVKNFQTTEYRIPNTEYH